MQGQIVKLENYAKETQMKIRMEKSKEMNFHTEKKIDFFPQVIIYNTTLDVVNKFKILGVVVTNDLKWNGNTKFITIRAYCNLWILRRLNIFGANSSELLDIYCKKS